MFTTLEAGGDARDDEGADLVGVLTARHYEVRDVADGQVERDTGVDDAVGGHERHVDVALKVQVR